MNWKIEGINRLARRVHEYCREHGFHEDLMPNPDYGEYLRENRHKFFEMKGLLQDELAEVGQILREKQIDAGKLREEVTDVFLRSLDLAAAMAVDLEEEVEKKMCANVTRPWRHGGEF